jgi:tetratricopeptide (TPR) repeat protein
LFLVLGMVLVMVILRVADRPKVVEEPGLVDIAELRNLGLAHLENGAYREAEAVFKSLAERLPDERLGFQNLAIARLLRIDPTELDPLNDPFEYAQQRDSAETAVVTLMSKFPDEFESNLIAARFAVHIGDVDRAFEKLEAAAKIRPQDPGVWYEMFEAGRFEKHDETVAKAEAALLKSWELGSDNLHVLKELLPVQARRHDVAVKKTLTQARQLVAPFVRKIRLFARVDLNEMLDKAVEAVPPEPEKTDAAVPQGTNAEAAEAAETDDNKDAALAARHAAEEAQRKEDKLWQPVVTRTAQFRNVLNPEVATQNDRKRVLRHVLEFVITDFSPKFYEKYKLAKAEFTLEIEVSLTPSPSKLPEVNGARDVALADFDLDGSLDVIAALPNRVAVYARESDDASADWAEKCSLELPDGVQGLCVVDLDRDAHDASYETGDGKHAVCADADLDLVVFGSGGVTVLKNELAEEGGQRSLVTMKQNDELSALRDVLEVLPVDFDHDGDLDLVVSSQSGVSLWLNREDWSFENHSEFSVLPPADSAIHTMIAVDWNRNVSIDVICLGEKSAGLLDNILHGQYRWREFEDETGAAALLAGATGAAITDADSNFSWDLVAARAESIILCPTRNPDAGVTQFLKPESLATSPSAGVLNWDYDNDGYLDVLSWNKDSLSTLRGGPQGQFQAVGKLDQKLPSKIVEAEAGDIDGDGDVDLAVVCENSIEVLINDGGNTNHWFDLPIRAEEAKDTQKANQRVNLHGIGSLIELKSGITYQPRVVTGRTTHFGLGQETHADSARVIWTNGIPTHVIVPEFGKPVCLQQELGGSCPFLYTWDGEKFAFFTDCLWAAPIGLQRADGVLAPTRDWEYLKIDGDHLKPRNGEYVLRMTEELWEIGYFDSVRLIAIDHPAGTEIYSNEKVGPPSVSEFHIHTVKSPRIPLAARDQQGRDVLPKIAAHDDDWLACFDHRFKQGLTEPHFLELDLGQLDDPKQVTLFLTGWIRPTDTSLNIAISQRPDLESTQPPSVHVPNENGEWIEVRPYMGFPGGKTKTIAIDLSNAFLANDYRVRIATTMEIYWDAAFFTVDDEPVTTRSTEQPLLAADLRYRGFSRRVEHPELGPDFFEYSQLSERPKWPPMEGRLTPYGDVMELVTTPDNQQALLGAGDEMELRFRATNIDLPKGWRRDFILHNVGWDKDANLNTVFGQTVDPLPFSGMKGYPDPDGPGATPPFANQKRVQSRSAFWRYFFDEDLCRVVRP